MASMQDAVDVVSSYLHNFFAFVLNPSTTGNPCLTIVSIFVTLVSEGLPKGVDLDIRTLNSASCAGFCNRNQSIFYIIGILHSRVHTCSRVQQHDLNRIQQQ